MQDQTWSIIPVQWHSETAQVQIINVIEVGHQKGRPEGKNLQQNHKIREGMWNVDRSVKAWDVNSKEKESNLAGG